MCVCVCVCVGGGGGEGVGHVLSGRGAMYMFVGGVCV